MTSPYLERRLRTLAEAITDIAEARRIIDRKVTAQPGTPLDDHSPAAAREATSDEIPKGQ